MKIAHLGRQLDTTHWVWGHHLDTFCLLADLWPGIILQAGLTGATQWKEVCCTTKWGTHWRGKLCELVTELHQGQKRPEAEVGFTASAGNTATRGRFLHSMDSEQINAHCTAPLRPTPPPTPPKPFLVANDNQTLAVIISRKFWDIVNRIPAAVTKQLSKRLWAAMLLLYCLTKSTSTSTNCDLGILNGQSHIKGTQLMTKGSKMRINDKWYMIQYMGMCKIRVTFKNFAIEREDVGLNCH